MNNNVISEYWKPQYLSEVLNALPGHAFKSVNFSKSEGIPLIRIRDLTKDSPEICYNGEYDKKFLVKKGDILIGMDGEFKIHVWSGNDALLNQRVCKLFNFSKEINPKFILYALQKYLDEIHQNTTFTTVKHISHNQILKIKLPIPKKQTQNKIVQKLDHILGKLEVKKEQILSLIEQNKERIDFFEKNWMSYVIDREIEKHPERNEWLKISLGETFDDFNQKWLPSTKNELVNYIGLENIESNTGKLVNFTPTESSKIKSSKTIFTKNQVLYGKLRPYLNKVHLPEFDGICSTDILSLTPKSNIDRQFLAYFLRSQLVLSHVNKSVHGTKMPRTKIQVLQEFLIQLPDLPIQTQIIQNIKSAEEKFQIQKKQFENIKNNYESKINYINHIQSSVLDSAFSGKLLN